MDRIVDRATGAFMALFGLALYFVIIPAGVTYTDSGWLFPQTIPNAVAFILIFCGALLAIFPTPQSIESGLQFFRAGLYTLVIAVGLFAMSYFGFAIVAPVLSLAIMLIMGERRVLWLSIGVIMMPGSVYLVAVELLNRALP